MVDAGLESPITTWTRARDISRSDRAAALQSAQHEPLSWSFRYDYASVGETDPSTVPGTAAYNVREEQARLADEFRMKWNRQMAREDV
jgi:hypothetical protein